MLRIPLRSRVRGTRLSHLTPLLLLSLLLFPAGCGDDSPSDPAGGGATVTDEITVSLDQINIVKDCDGGGGGEFAYKFYVQTYVDGAMVSTYLSTDWSSFTVGNNTAWDPNDATTFQLERRAGVHFKVRVSMRELDSVEHFTLGEFVTHDIKSGQAPWTPTRGNGSEGYDLYDAGKQIGEVDFLCDIDAACEASMTYSVSYGTPAD